MKELISKILKEHLNVLNEGIHAEIYDKYSFDDFDITSFKGNKYVFLNGTKQLTNDIVPLLKDWECHETCHGHHDELNMTCHASALLLL